MVKLSASRVIVILLIVIAAVYILIPKAQPETIGLRAVQAIDANSLDIHRTKLDWAYQVIALAHDTLMTFNYDMEYIPLLAESWEKDPDGLFIDYHLREDVTFHCGRPFNADAVVYSIRRCREPWSAHADSVKNVLDAERLDEYTVRIHLVKWDRWLYDWFATTSSSIVCPHCADEHGLAYGVSEFCGTGPFKVKEWKREDRILLERNEDYRWGPEIYQNRGPAHLDGITFEVIPTDLSREEKFKRGEADMMIGLAPRPALVEYLNTTEGVVFIINARSSMSYVGFNVGTLSPEIQQGLVSGRPYPPGAGDSPVRDDPEGKGLLVRKALLYATHRENLVRYAWEGMGKVAYGPLTSVIWGYEPATEDMYPYDPEMARNLLAQAGYADGLKLTIFTTNYEPYVKTAEVLKEQWKEVGVELEIEVRVFDDIETIIADGNHDLWIGGWTWHNADMIWWYWHTIRVPPASNRFWWGSAYADEVIDNTFVIDDDVAYYAIQESQRLIMEDAAYLPVVERPFLLAHWDRVKDFTMHPLSNFIWKHLDTVIEE
ncbi:hypothetical protein ES703_06672 [subsurface metagenome]